MEWPRELLALPGQKQQQRNKQTKNFLCRRRKRCEDSRRVTSEKVQIHITSESCWVLAMTQREAEKSDLERKSKLSWKESVSSQDSCAMQEPSVRCLSPGQVVSTSFTQAGSVKAIGPQ